MRKIVITGGSRGIGAAAVRRFAENGDTVTFLYEKAHEAAQAIARETGAHAICCNVADETAVQAAFREIGDVDVLINNAGICHYGLISQITPDEWRRLFAVNVDGAFFCTRAALPSMLQKQAGCIINISSMWGLRGASCEVAYACTKAALIALTRSLALELAPSHIRVNCVAPGVIDTDMVQVLGQDVLDDLAVQTPLGRLGTPADIAHAVAFFASEKASFITGQVLTADGGFIV